MSGRYSSSTASTQQLGAIKVSATTYILCGFALNFHSVSHGGQGTKLH